MHGVFMVFFPLKHGPANIHKRKDDSLSTSHENITSVKELRLYQAAQDSAFAIKILHIL